VCPAGGGKTIIAAAALAKVADPFDRIGWVCNTREQAEQAAKALAACGVSPTWIRCMAGLTPNEAAQVEYLVIDEAHHVASAVTWQMVFAACKGVCWGLTATPKSGDLDKDAFFMGLWKSGVVTVPREELLDAGHLAKGVVRILDVDTANEHQAAIDAGTCKHLLEDYSESRVFGVAACIAPILRSGDYCGADAQRVLARLAKIHGERFEQAEKRHAWRQTLKCVLSSEKRNAKAVEVAQKHIEAGDTVIILVGSIEQGKALAEQIPGAICAYSGMGKKARTHVMEAMRSGAVRCMVATSLADEGLDIPRASVLIYATFGKSLRLIEQRSGRVMRTHEGKDFGIVYDFADTGAGMARHHSRSRITQYRKLGYKIES
jgi:superfamily II DNA or RNA helicase